MPPPEAVKTSGEAAKAGHATEGPTSTASARAPESIDLSTFPVEEPSFNLEGALSAFESAAAEPAAAAREMAKDFKGASDPVEIAAARQPLTDEDAAPDSDATEAPERAANSEEVFSGLKLAGPCCNTDGSTTPQGSPSPPPGENSAPSAQPTQVQAQPATTSTAAGWVDRGLPSSSESRAVNLPGIGIAQADSRPGPDNRHQVREVHQQPFESHRPELAATRPPVGTEPAREEPKDFYRRSEIPGDSRFTERVQAEEPGLHPPIAPQVETAKAPDTILREERAKHQGAESIRSPAEGARERVSVAQPTALIRELREQNRPLPAAPADSLPGGPDRSPNQTRQPGKERVPETRAIERLPLRSFAQSSGLPSPDVSNLSHRPASAPPPAASPQPGEPTVVQRSRPVQQEPVQKTTPLPTKAAPDSAAPFSGGLRSRLEIMDRRTHRERQAGAVPTPAARYISKEPEGNIYARLLQRLLVASHDQQRGRDAQRAALRARDLIRLGVVLSKRTSRSALESLEARLAAAKSGLTGRRLALLARELRYMLARSHLIAVERGFARPGSVTKRDLAPLIHTLRKLDPSRVSVAALRRLTIVALRLEQERRRHPTALPARMREELQRNIRALLAGKARHLEAQLKLKLRRTGNAALPGRSELSVIIRRRERELARLLAARKLLMDLKRLDSRESAVRGSSRLLQKQLREVSSQIAVARTALRRLWALRRCVDLLDVLERMNSLSAQELAALLADAMDEGLSEPRRKSRRHRALARPRRKPRTMPGEAGESPREPGRSIQAAAGRKRKEPVQPMGATINPKTGQAIHAATSTPSRSLDVMQSKEDDNTPNEYVAALILEQQAGSDH